MAQRITGGMMINDFTRNLAVNQRKMQKFENQMASNKKIVRLSDDPVGAVKALSARSKMREIEQYQRNIKDGTSLLKQSETALSEVNEITKRLYELTVQASNETNTPADRQAIANEVQEWRDQLLVASNTSLSNKYIFGGYNATSLPFGLADSEDVPGRQVMTYNGVPMYKIDPDTGRAVDWDANDLELRQLNQLNKSVSYNINFGVDIDVTIPGGDAMGLGKNNLYGLFDDLLSALNSDKMENLEPFIQDLQDAQGRNLANIAEIGGRQNRLDGMAERFDDDHLNYMTILSDVEDLDLAETTMWFKMAEAVFNAALSVGAKVIQPSLVDYLK